jgi:hypothetical protein
MGSVGCVESWLNVPVAVSTVVPMNPGYTIAAASPVRAVPVMPTCPDEAMGSGTRTGLRATLKLPDVADPHTV